MFTRCPHCQTIFKISAEQLRLGAGKARCSQCQKVFSALSALNDEHSIISGTKNYPHPELLSLKGKSYSDTDNKLLSRHTDIIRKDNLEASLADQDYFKTSPTQQQSRKVFIWLLVSFALVLTLLLQHLHFNSIHYSQNTLLGSTINNLCKITQCKVALASAPKLIKVVGGTHVIANQELKDILNIKLSFINQANFIQRYPLLKIVFSDTLGQLIAERIFYPYEYLPTSQQQIEQGLRVQQQVDILLQIVDPMPKVSLSFEVIFL